MPKRAILYARVSSDDQAERGTSLQSQFEAMRAYAAQQGFTVVRELREDYSGAKLSRPALDVAREILAQHEADIIIVFSPDRLSRNLAHSLILREEWLRDGIELHYCNRGKSENTPESRMTENIEAVFAEYWREKIIEANWRGRRQKAANGKWVGNGYPPYGYKKVKRGRDATLAIDEERAAVVKRIFAIYLGVGGEQPMSIHAIVATLTEEVVTPPQGTKWYIQTVRCILSRPQYTGTFKYGAHKIQQPHLAIVSVQALEMAKARIMKNRELATRNCKREYLLSGHIKCACGGGMYGHTRREGVSYYRCMRKCGAREVRRERADPIVWEWVAGLVSDEKSLAAGLQRMAERSEAELEPKRKRLALIDELLGRSEGKIHKLLSAFADEADDAIGGAIREQVKALQKERAALTTEREQLAGELAQDEITLEQQAAVLKTVSQLREGIAEADFETKRYLLDRLDVLVRVRTEDGRRVLDVSCGITPEAATIEYCASGSG